MITTTSELYEFTEMAIQKCREHGYGEVAQQLEDAMHLGSSRLEILGAIKATCVHQAAMLAKVVDKANLQDVVNFVNNAFGTE